MHLHSEISLALLRDSTIMFILFQVSNEPKHMYMYIEITKYLVFKYVVLIILYIIDNVNNIRRI